MAKKIEKTEIEENTNDLNTEIEDLKQINKEKINRINELELEVSNLLMKYSKLEKDLKQSSDENNNNLDFIQKMKDEIKTMKDNYNNNDKADVIKNEVIYSKGDNVYLKKYGNQVFKIIENVGYTNDGDVLYSLYDSLNLTEIDAYPQSKIIKK
jgi:chromosome segregation ATPase